MISLKQPRHKYPSFSSGSTIPDGDRPGQGARGGWAGRAKRVLATRRIAIKHEPAGSEQSLLGVWREHRWTVCETQKGKERGTCLCSGSEVFLEECGLVYGPLGHQGTGQNKGKGPGVLQKSLVPRSQGSGHQDI